MRTINSIIVHHSEGEGDFHSVKKWQTQDPGGPHFRHVAYYVVIDKLGRAIKSYPEEKIAGGCDKQSHASRTSLEVCLCGDMNKHRPFPAECDALEELLIKWCKKYEIAPDNIKGHKDVQHRKHDPDRANTCPGNYLWAYLPVLRLRVSRALSGDGD